MSDINWNNVVSAVATEDGLLVTERGVDGTVGATPRLMPYQTSYSGRQTNAGTQPTPPELPPPPGKDPFGSETKMTCTDAALKTYRFVTVPKGYVREVNAVMACPPGQVRLGKRCVFAYTPPFKACSDADALQLLLYTIMDEAYCLRLERLDAKPGYVSTWTPVSSNC